MAVRAIGLKVEQLHTEGQEPVGHDWSALGALVRSLSIEAVAEHALRLSETADVATGETA
jgi:hypothetical protein